MKSCLEQGRVFLPSSFFSPFAGQGRRRHVPFHFWTTKYREGKKIEDSQQFITLEFIEKTINYDLRRPY